MSAIISYDELMAPPSRMPGPLKGIFKKPEKSIDQLISDVCEKAKNRKPIYLDTNFWICLRFAALQKPRNENEIIFLDEVTRLYNSGKYFFPLSDAIMVEVVGQTSSDIRVPCARLMSRLSDEISVKNYWERAESEIKSLIYRSFNLDPIWVPASYAIGDIFSEDVSKFLPGCIRTRVSGRLKANLGAKSFVEIIESVGDLTVDQFKKVAVILNKNKENDPPFSYKHVRIANVIGIIEKYGGDISLTQKTDFLNLFHECRNLFPTLDVIATMIAISRIDENFKFTGNDVVDMFHASAAFASSKIMLTDRGVFYRANYRPDNLSEIHSKTVIKGLPNAIAQLKAF